MYSLVENKKRCIILLYTNDVFFIVPESTHQQLHKPDEVRKNLVDSQAFVTDDVTKVPELVLDMVPHQNKSSHKKKKKSREKHAHKLDNDGRHSVSHHNEDDLCKRKMHMYNLDQPATETNDRLGDQTLELRVPKLIVRRVKKKDGDNEIETLEVYSPDKNNTVFQLNSTYNADDDIPKKHTRSKTLSVSSGDSLKERKRKKKRVINDSISSMDEKENDYIEYDHLADDDVLKKRTHSKASTVSSVEYVKGRKRRKVINDSISSDEEEEWNEDPIQGIIFSG